VKVQILIFDPNLWDGLVGAWMPSLGVTGNSLRDVSGNRNHGTLTSMDPATDWVTTSRGLALDFDGVDDHVEVGTNEPLEGKYENTFGGWVRFSSGSSFVGTIIGKNGYSGNPSAWTLQWHNGTVVFSGRRWNNTTFHSFGSVNSNWYHFLVRTDRVSQALYVNGNLEVSDNITGVGAVLDHSQSLQIGKQDVASFERPWKGEIGFTSVYDRALSPNEIKQLYVDPLAPFRQKSIRIFGGVGIPTDTSKIITVKRSKHVEPSYKSGYAQSASESASPHLWDGLVGAWMPSFGSTGGTLRDVSGNRNHGTLTGMDPATDWVTTSKGLALDFDGVNDYVEVPDNESLSIATSDWTIVCLLKNLQGTTNTGKFEGIVQKGYFEANTGWEILRNGTNASGPIGCVAVAYGNQAQYGNTAMSSTDFSSIVWRKKGTNSTLWLNGNLDDETTLGSKNEYSSPLVIGQRNLSAFSPGYFNGPISSVYIFDRALSPNEIKQLYVDPLAPFRKKQQIAFNAYPLTLLEKIRSVAKPTTTRAISVKKNSVPSYKAGYAKSASESAHPNLWDGLVGAWMPSLGVTGDTLRDVSGNGNHGTLTNMDAATDWVATSKGLALDFDGVNDYVESQDSIDAMGSSPRTLSSSFEIRSTANQTIAGFGNPSASQWFYILIFQGKWYFSGYANDFSIATPLPTLGKHHLAVSYDSSDVRFYLDNLLIAQFAKTLNTQAGVLRIGLRAGFNDFPLNGQVDSVYFHNRALSPQEIKQIYVDSLAPFRKKTLTVGYQPSKELRGLFRT
jgi:hypothetical protein